MAQSLDYGNSLFRASLSWLAYPVFVLLPFGWLTMNFDFEQTGLLVGFAFVSLLTAGIMEWIHPHAVEWRRSHDDVLTDIAHQLCTSVLAQLLRVVLVVGFFLLVRGTAEDFALTGWPTSWPLWGQAVIGLLVAEFGDYWRHRLFHAWPLPWRLHAVHHCSKRLYFLNANRFHFIDACLASLAGAIPLALCGASAEVAALVGIFTGLHGPWQHANVRYRLGWLNWIFSGAELHRWHHSTTAHHCDSNYGNNLIVFDALFGTRQLPKDQPDTGPLGLVAYDSRFPKTWWRQQLVPFRWRSMLGNEPAHPPS
jgi:sterol desaturase/sphingolipid hydroxylase (fatty acid hydroxylase superfamily)